MAEVCLLSFLFFFAAFVSAVQSRVQQQSPTTSFLDVEASIRRTKDARPAVRTETAAYESRRQERRTPDNYSPSLALRLRSRDSIPGTAQEDYRSLMMSRLKRDAARVRFLSYRLDLAVRGISQSDLEPTESGVALTAEEIEGAVVSGTSQGSGEYFSRVAIGNPPREIYMVVDTGSDVSWVQCAPCADCCQQADPVFQPSLSSSYSPLTCDTQQCRALEVSQCRNNTCLYEVSYGDGSYTVGDFVTETVTLGSASLRNVAIGCGHNNQGLFVGAAGLLGLGGGSLSFPSQLNASSFSYCLVDRDSDSASTLEFDSALPPDAITAPLLRNRQLDTFYYVRLTGISVGGELLPVPDSAFTMDEAGSGGVIVDSGTAVTRLQEDAYNLLRDSFVRGSRDLPSTTGVALFDTCYDLSSRASVEVPAVSFHFPNGKILSLPAKNYMIPVDSKGTFCLAFAPTRSSLSIIGNVQQQGTRVAFDLANSLIGFSPDDC